MNNRSITNEKKYFEKAFLEAIWLLPFCFLLFRFYVVIISFSIQKILLYGSLLLYISYNYTKGSFQFSRKILIRNLLLFTFIISCSWLVTILHSTGDSSYTYSLITYGVDALCWIAFAIHVKNKSIRNNKTEVDNFINDYCKIIVLYVLFTLFTMVFKEFTAWYKGIVYVSETQELYFLRYAKYSGRFSWNGFAGIDSTFKCSIACLCSLIALNNPKNISSKKKYLFYIIISLLGNILYGRTGLISSLLMIVVFVCVSLFNKKKAKVSFTILGFILFAILFLFIYSKVNSGFGDMMSWSLELFINYANGEGLTTVSSSRLSEMYIIPSIKTFILGDGYYTDPITLRYYMGTDVGFLRIIYYWGIGLTVLVYYWTLKLFKSSKIFNGIIMVMLLIIFVMFEMKGEIYRTLLCIGMAFTLISSSGYINIYDDTKITISKNDV